MSDAIPSKKESRPQPSPSKSRIEYLRELASWAGVQWSGHSMHATAEDAIHKAADYAEELDRRRAAETKARRMFCPPLTPVKCVNCQQEWSQHEGDLRLCPPSAVKSEVNLSAPVTAGSSIAEPSIPLPAEGLGSKAVVRTFPMSKEGVQGREAAHEGKGFLDNPYDSYSNEGRRWIDGYVEGLKELREKENVEQWLDRCRLR